MKVKNPFRNRKESSKKSAASIATGPSTDQSSDDNDDSSFSDDSSVVGTFRTKSSQLRNLPSFDVENILCGNVLGQGAFCVVTSVLNMPSLSSRRNKKATTTSSASSSFKTEYALKRLHYDDTKFKNMDQAVAAIANEAWFLQRIQHPHIIQLHAVPGDPRWTAGGDGKALVVDRLYKTLQDQKKKWIRKQERLVKTDTGESSLETFRLERLQICLELSSALRYLHRHRVLHRDLKPGNVGFDTNGTLKLFDFGMARTLPTDKRHSAYSTYKMTKETGTRRYMSPEVVLGKPYNAGCDVYAFSLILWELVTLAGKPLGQYSGADALRQAVCVRGERPSFDDVSSDNLKEALAFGWHDDLCRRWTMRQMQRALQLECCQDDSSIETEAASM